MIHQFRRRHLSRTVRRVWSWSRLISVVAVLVTAPLVGEAREGPQSVAPLAARRPRSEVELYVVTGIGPTIVEKYGQDLLAIVRGAGR